MSVCNNIMRNHVDLNRFDIPAIMEFKRETVMITNTEEYIRQCDLDQIIFLKQKLKIFHRDLDRFDP